MNRSARDSIWIARIQQGDGRALGELLRSYLEWLVSVALPVTGSQDLAQDVVQDVFMRLWDGRKTLEVRGSVAGYLYRAVRNQAINIASSERARRAREQKVSEGELWTTPVAHNDAEDTLEHDDFQLQLSGALKRLPPRTREIFLMHIDQGMSYAEIADVLSIGVPTVHTQMYRATRGLARSMAQWVDPERRFDLRDNERSK